MKIILPWFLALVFAATSIYLFVSGQSVELELVRAKAQLKGTATSAGPGGADMVQISQNELNRLRQDAEEIHRLRSEMAQMERAQQSRPNPGDKHVSPESTAGNDVVPATDPDEPQDNLTPVQREQGEKCVLNMQAIEEAKAMWAAAHNKGAGDSMTIADITTALPNSTMPLCPAGGTYQLNVVGVPVTCTIPGHSLLP